ncbi:hypothetical protein VCR6J2_230033 [Vibrio coralliirubri]|nr:hypothetical protein VCR6J2_230033 [Vibrio coralliirubri]CDT31884.1 hypothetical protein VCR1J2_400088 [Vibrio coralliirubri]
MGDVNGAMVTRESKDASSVITLSYLSLI